MLVFAIRPPLTEAAVKIIELSNIWNHKESKGDAAKTHSIVQISMQ